MKVVVYEDNLIWSSRLAGAIRSLDHEPIILRSADAAMPEDVNVAIVNLTSPTLDARAIIHQIQGRALILGHGGHKELASLPEDLKNACGVISTNGLISMKFAHVFGQVVEKLSEMPQPS